MNQGPETRLLLAGYTVLDTTEGEAIDRALVANFHNARARIESKDRFRIVYNHLDLGGVSLNAAITTAGYTIHADAAQDSLVLLCLTHGRMDIRSRHAARTCVSGKNWAMLDFAEPSVLSTTGKYNNICMRYARSRLEDALASLCGRPSRTPLAFSPSIPCDGPGARRLWSVIGQIVTAFEGDTDLVREPLLVAQYERLLLTATLTCLAHNASELFSGPVSGARPKVIRLVEEFIEAHADKPLSLLDLAELTGLGARSIQLAFKRHRGYSPSRFLRECRLTRARALLRQASPGASVASVSLECGFASQSAFSRLYAARFGEKPLETLRAHAS